MEAGSDFGKYGNLRVCVMVMHYWIACTLLFSMTQLISGQTHHFFTHYIHVPTGFRRTCG